MYKPSLINNIPIMNLINCRKENLILKVIRCHKNDNKYWNNTLAYPLI